MNDPLKPKTYLVEGLCSNCGNKQDISVAKGVQTPEKARCFNCGCLTLIPRKYWIEEQNAKNLAELMRGWKGEA